MVMRKVGARVPANRPKGVEPSADPTLWSDLAAIGATITASDKKLFPKDGARNLDHYLYGTPKQDPD